MCIAENEFDWKKFATELNSIYSYFKKFDFNCSHM